MDSTTIHSVFSIGRYCDADFLLKDMYIRGYSSPFSWMYIDLQTALYFVEENFECFTDAVHPRGDTSFVHRGFLKADGETYDPSAERVCQWIHHDLSDSATISAIKRRSERLLACIYSPSTLLVYYDIVARPTEYYKDIIGPFTKKYGCNILVIAPVPDLQGQPVVAFRSEQVCIIHRGNAPMRALLNYLYTFQIMPLDESEDKPQSEPVQVGGML